MRTTVTLLALAAALILPSAAAAKGCPPSTPGTAVFENVKVKGVRCSTVRDVLNRTTLAKNRRDRTRWEYAGWRWRIEDVTTYQRQIFGFKSGNRIRALWYQR